MKTIQKTGWVAIAIALAAVSQEPRFLHADGPTQSADTVVHPSLADLAAQAISTDTAISKPAIEKLRAAGPAGLDALLDANADAIAAHRAGVVPASRDSNWPRVTAALDAVAAQRNAYASGLYWYTDLPAAESAAKSSGKPILSLRLLGNLNDEYSCANSRFFRTVLYANQEVAQHLRDHFILHWQSVRPVPVITIDFGDGRIIRRTITGNSIHYVLTADGEVVDGIPGLYGAKAFLRVLGEDEPEVADLGKRQGDDRNRSLTTWHSNQLSNIDRAFTNDRASLGVAVTAVPSPVTLHAGFGGTISGAGGPLKTPGSAPDAGQAARRAISKSSFENPLLIQIQTPAPGKKDPGGQPKLPLLIFNPDETKLHMDDLNVVSPDITPNAGLIYSHTVYELGSGVVEPGSMYQNAGQPDELHTNLRAEDLDISTEPMERDLTDSDWSRIAALHADDAQLDSGSRSLMAAKTLDAATAARITRSKAMVETPLVRMMRNFQRSIAEDTVRNEYLLHSQIHRWLSDPSQIALSGDVSTLNKRVYAELFLTPDSDPWLGLVPADTYSALDDGGVCH